MNTLHEVATHYGEADLLGKIAEGVERLDKLPGSVTIEDLAPVDEFHIGGALATGMFFESVALDEGDRVLDIGCGIGGSARFAAETYGCRVTGVDLTPEYVRTGNALCSWVGLDRWVELTEGNALATSFDSGSFDKAYMLHVGMNIEDKRGLAREAWRVLRPGGTFGIYDVMRAGSGSLTFPVPWATESGTSFVDSPDDYRRALEEAGFVVTQVTDRRAFALEFFERLEADASEAAGPPPLGLHILMGATAATKIGNMIDNIRAGLVAPVEIVATKAG